MFTSTNFLVLSFDGCLLVLSSKFMIFWYSIVPLLLLYYNYNNRSSIIICSQFSGGMYISLNILVDSSILVEFFRSSRVLFVAIFAIISAIFFPTRPPVASADFWIALPLWSSHKSIGCWLLFFIKKHICIYCSIFLHNVCKGYKSIAFDIDSTCGFSSGSHYITLPLVTTVKFIFSSISRGVDLWSVNHASVYKNSERNVSV